MARRSLPQIDDARMRTRTCPCPGDGTGTSTISTRRPPGRRTPRIVPAISSPRSPRIVASVAGRRGDRLLDGDRAQVLVVEHEVGGEHGVVQLVRPAGADDG